MPLGLHLNLTEGPPTADVDEVPSLVVWQTNWWPAASTATTRCAELERRILELERRAADAEQRVGQLRQELDRQENETPTSVLRRNLLDLVKRFHPDRFHAASITPTELTQVLIGFVQQLDA